MHLTNRDIAYISNGTNPNTLGIVPAFNLGKCVSEDGTQEWNYNSALSPGSRWVLKTNSSTSEHWFFSGSSNVTPMQHSTPVIIEFDSQFSVAPNKFELITASPIVGVRALQSFTTIVNGFVNIVSPVSGDIFVAIKLNTSGLFSQIRETLVAGAYKSIPISVPFNVSNTDIIRLELTLGGSTPAGTHSVLINECKLNFSVLT